MFKIFKPNRRKWQSLQKPSSMPHRTSNFNFQQLSKPKKPSQEQQISDKFSIESLTNRFLQSPTSRLSNRSGFPSSDNQYALLKERMYEKKAVYTSQKSLRKKESLTQRNFFQGGKGVSNLMDFKKSSLMKIDLDKFLYRKPKTEVSCIHSNSKDFSISQSFRRSTQKISKQSDKASVSSSIKKSNWQKRKQESFEQDSIQSHNEKTEYCSIAIVIETKQEQLEFSVRYKVRKIGALVEFLKKYVQNKIVNRRFSKEFIDYQRQIVSFQTADYNLQLDYYLTLDEEDGSFLNGQSFTLKPVYFQTQPTVTLNSFEILQCIGSGGFSNVYLCRFKENGKFYAMKVISKSFIVKNQKKSIIMNERNIMAELRNQLNIAKLYFSFESKEYLVFVMEYYAGGELFNLVKKFRKMDQKKARFYITEILLGLEQVHDHNIVYRDFKPQNIMIDIEGHAYIADFGLAKPKISTINDRAYSFCGSPEYMPPEMILKQGHSLPVDFYCIGALLYELVTGLPPFYNTDPDAIYEGTLSQDVTFPQHAILSKQIQDLLLGLLQKQEKYRLGSTFGVQEILGHPWFRSIKKEDFMIKKVTPPVNFKRIEDLRFNIDEMQEENQKQMKQILKSQKIQASAKYLKIMNGFYYDYRLNQSCEGKQNDQIENEKDFKKIKARLSVEKPKNNSQSIALTNCTKRSQNSLITGNPLDAKQLGSQDFGWKKSVDARQKNTKSSFIKEHKIFSNDKKLSRGLKSVEKRMLKEMQNYID